MTFRSRVITATVVAAALAVVLACFASFLTTRNALFNAVDQSLLQTSQGPTSLHANDPHFTGSYTELVLASGQTVPTTGVPIDALIKSYAKGKSGHLLRTIQIGNQSYRELIVGLPKDSVVSGTSGLYEVSGTSAQLFVVNVTGQENELRSLVRTLLIVAASGLLLALALGWLLARAALRPLEEVTNEIETITETNDMRHRIQEGDADELGRLRRVFNRLLSSVESSQTLQRQLVLDASHELRTPLTSLLTDLGELARGERSEGTVVPLRLDECVDECVDTARTYARIKDITIDSQVEPSTIVGRRDRLVRAISNLLTNAVKFTPRGGRIVVRSSSGSVSVSDSGPGISDEDIPFVFDRFWRSASSRALPGSGLGLSIVAQVAAEFQGTVTVDRDPELAGARFTFTLPSGDGDTTD